MSVRFPLRISLVLTMVLASAAVGTLSNRTAAAREIGLTTAYQTEPILLTIKGEQRELRGVNLRVDLHSGTGVLQLDATTCSKVDPWGEVADCAPGLYAPENIRLAQVKMADPTGHGRRLFRVFDGSPEEALFLVVPSRQCDSYRLSVEAKGGKVTRVITLEFDESMCAPPPRCAKTVCTPRRTSICAAIRARCRRIAR